MGVFSAQSGYGAIYETARILNAFREQVIEPSLTFNPGLVFGGTNVSSGLARLPAHAICVAVTR